MLQYLGLFNLVFLIVGLLWLSGKDKNYSLRKKPISAIADNKNNKMWFVVFICTFSVLQLLFAEVALQKLHIHRAGYISTLLLVGVALLTLSAFTVEKYKILHLKLVQAGVAAVAIGVVILSIDMLEINTYAGLIILILTPLLLIAQHILRKKRKVGYWELPLLLMIIIWNITATLLII